MRSKNRFAFLGAPRGVAALAIAAFVTAACTGDTPTAPREVAQAGRPGAGFVTAQNATPNLNLKTKPVADRTGAIPTITGQAPLSVRFNLCTSDDADQVLGPDGRELPNGDSLNWQFNFGDPNRYAIGPTGIPAPDPAFDPITGAFRPDFDRFCRVDHVYEDEGIYIATVSVTDKHQEDQGAGALARRSERVRIVALGEPVVDLPGCTAPTSISIPDSGVDTCSPPGTFDASPFFSGTGLTYALEELSCGGSRGVSALGSFDTINPVTGVITPASSGTSCLRVTATNACGSTSQQFALDAFCDD
jgi:hypothetical protein